MDGMMKHEYLNGVSAIATKPKGNVWRATLKLEELTACGFDATAENAYDVLIGILKLKGVPAQYLEPGKQFRAEVLKSGTLLVEFE
jgi:hypothetical protein